MAGGMAGALSKTCTAPLARLTILFQVQGMHSVATLRRLAYGMRLLEYLGKDLELSGRGILSQLLIGCLTHLSIFIHTNTIKRAHDPTVSEFGLWQSIGNCILNSSPFHVMSAPYVYHKTEEQEM
ncbi:hypothetical protein GH714_036442 [Hevea brasiliensis]|uniref:Uncharacterized protein n=1 Tax=Hevea brasiliensis TaxID=3981 RepID=A0A6A6L5A2_HEVBR|nr:hypothetical protein GH714_036442 [Hevea brasiliensis]